MVAIFAAYVAGRKHGESGTDYDFSTVGVPLRGEGIVQTSSWLGIGAGVFANLNAKRSAGSLMLLMSISNP